MAAGKITLREAQAIAHLLEHGRWPDPDTAGWIEGRASKVALDFLLLARLRGTVAATLALAEESASVGDEAGSDERGRTR